MYGVIEKENESPAQTQGSAKAPADGETGLATEKKRLSPAQRRSRRRKRRIRLAILWTVFLAATAVLVFVIVAIIFTAMERKAARDQYAQMQTMYEVSVEPQQTEADPEPAEETERLDPSKWYADKARIADKKIDFDALQSRNADVCAWITVDDTTIDYPVLKAEGKDVLYLSHDIDGKASEHGAVCLDVLCARDFSDRVTLIYGHNMKDGSMFAPLYDYYKDPAFFNGDHRIHIYLDNAELTYRVVAAYEYSYAHPLFYYDMTNDEDFAAYCDIFLSPRDLTARSLQTEINPEDHLLTLITSTNVRADRRLFVQAVLTDAE